MEYITDSEGSDVESAGADSDRESEDAQDRDLDDDYTGNVKRPRLKTSIRLSLPNTPANGRTTRKTETKEFVCVCANGGDRGRLKVGKCFGCSRLLHLSCRARNAAALAGWMCYDCPGQSLEILKFDAKDLTAVNGTEVQKSPLPATADNAETHRLTKASAHTKPSPAEEIHCVCPSRASKVRTRLAKCVDCGIVLHIPCRARTRAGTSGYMCLNCPEGLLETVPDRIADKSTSGKALTKQLNVKASQSNTTSNSSPLARTRNLTKQHQAMATPANRSKPDAVSAEAARETSTQHQDVRQRAVPNTKIRSTHARRAAKPTEDQISQQLDSMYTTLATRSKEAKQNPEPRITNLHHIFLRTVPIKALWEHYCIMLDGLTTDAAVAKATEVHFVDYRVEPITAAPEAWGKEIKYRLGLLLDAATNDGQVMHLSARTWELDAGMALRHVRDIAMEVLHHGAYKGKRARLGVLGEVLGLSEKGTFWKGGDVFAGDS